MKIHRGVFTDPGLSRVKKVFNANEKLSFPANILFFSNPCFYIVIIYFKRKVGLQGANVVRKSQLLFLDNVYFCLFSCSLDVTSPSAVADYKN